MTDLGKSLIEEGIEKGLQKGIGKGKSELLIMQLMKKFKKVPQEYKEKIIELPEDTLDLIGSEIFDLKSVEDLKQYL